MHKSWQTETAGCENNNVETDRVLFGRDYFVAVGIICCIYSFSVSYCLM